MGISRVNEMNGGTCNQSATNGGGNHIKSLPLGSVELSGLIRDRVILCTVE